MGFFMHFIEAILCDENKLKYFLPSHYWLRLVATTKTALNYFSSSWLLSNRLHLRQLQVTFFRLRFMFFFVSLCVKKSWKIIYLLFKCARAKEREKGCVDDEKRKSFEEKNCDAVCVSRLSNEVNDLEKIWNLSYLEETFVVI